MCGKIVRGLMSDKRFWAIFVMYDQEMTMHGRKEVFQVLEKCTKDSRYEEKLSCIGPKVDNQYVLHIPAAPCSEILPDVEYSDITITYPVL